MKKLAFVAYTLAILTIGAGLGAWGYTQAQADECYSAKATCNGVTARMSVTGPNMNPPYVYLILEGATIAAVDKNASNVALIFFKKK